MQLQEEQVRHQPMQPPLTKKQVADFLQVSERTIDRWRAEGRLQCFKYRGTVRFRPEWVEELLTRKTKPVKFLTAR